MIGQTISHYRILEKLGEGGMGVVYRAEDTKLKRTVALKFLSPHLLTDEQHKRRFIHEAQAAAVLTHPHICTIHEIDEANGHTFMVMEYIEGESLRQKIEAGTLDVGNALDIVIQIAKGLTKAHDQGIIHRDIKPGNVLMTPEGDAKIVDFGLAKLAAQTRLTKTGTSVGTISYMSPEQATGKEVDHRTDIWALGVMLYEMLAGRLPFRGDHEQAVLYLVINEDPEPVTHIRDDVPAELEEIVEKALAKSPDKRFAMISEFSGALEDLRDRLTLGMKERRFASLRRIRRRKRLVYGTAASVVLLAAALTSQLYFSRSTAMDSIAVLPLENLSDDADQEYLVDGITGDLITGLSRVRGFKKVISRLSMMQYKGTQRSLKEIARDLGVRVVMAGTLQRMDGRVKLGVELIDAATGQNLWSESYERNVGEIEMLIDDIARTVAGEIDIDLTEEEEAALARNHPVNPDAYEAYLRGRAFAEEWSDKGFEKSFEYLEQAIDKDPNYAPAYAQLVKTYADAHRWGSMSYDEAYPFAGQAVARAMELDDQSRDSQVALGMYRFVFEWDWSGADAAFRQALSLDPNNADTHRSYGNFLVHMGQREESILEFKRARELAPLSIFVNQNLGWACYHARRYDEAISQFERTRALLDQFPDPWKRHQIDRQLLWCYLAKGNYDKAFEKLDELGDFVGPLAWDRLWAFVGSGRRDEIEGAVENLLREPAKPDADYRSSGVHPWSLAILNETDRAIHVLESIYADHGFSVLFAPISPEYDNLRSDSRFQALLARLDLPWRPDGRR